MEIEENCHGGKNSITVFRAFDQNLSDEKIDFIDFVLLPPAATIGRHKHGDNTEWYVILSGHGTMLFKDEVIDVKPWDALANPPFGEHELKNDSEEDITLIVFQLSKGIPCG